MGFDCPGISRLSVLRTHYRCDDALEKVTRMLEREQPALAVCPPSIYIYGLEAKLMAAQPEADPHPDGKNETLILKNSL